MNAYEIVIYNELKYLANKFNFDEDDDYYEKDFHDWVDKNLDKLTKAIYNNEHNLFDEVQEKISEVAEELYGIDKNYQKQQNKDDFVK